MPLYLKFKRGRHLTILLLIALIQKCNMQCRELKQNCKRCAWKGNCFSDWSSCCQMTSLSFASVHALFIEVEASFGRFAFDCPNTEIQYTMHTAQTEMKIAFQIDLLILKEIWECMKWNLLSRLIFPPVKWHHFLWSTPCPFSPLIFSWKENKLSPNFFLPLGDPHKWFYNLFQCQLQIAAWSLASNRKSDQDADFLFKVFLLWSNDQR